MIVLSALGKTGRLDGGASRENRLEIGPNSYFWMISSCGPVHKLTGKSVLIDAEGVSIESNECLCMISRSLDLLLKSKIVIMRTGAGSCDNTGAVASRRMSAMVALAGGIEYVRRRLLFTRPYRGFVHRNTLIRSDYIQINFNMH